MGKEQSDDTTVNDRGGNVLLIAGIAGSAFVLLLCCGGISIVAFFVGRESDRETDIVDRWEVDEISKLILDFRGDGTGTIEVPEVRVRIPITYILQGDELTITQAPAQGIDVGACMVLERLERTRVSRIGNQLRMEALPGPRQGQVMVLRTIASPSVFLRIKAGVGSKFG